MGRIALALILAGAIGIRLFHLGFGLPALNDPDEPLFVMNALDMLRERRLDPQWFGHPATTLFYALDLIFVIVGVVGGWLGRWHGADGYMAALFADPGVAILPMRLFIVACAAITIWQTCRIGMRGANQRTGLIAALLLACSCGHAELSQVIRSDILACVFMLWSTAQALEIGRTGRPRAYLLAGLAAGVGAATKWPAILILGNAAGAALLRAWQGRAEGRSLKPGLSALMLLPALPAAAVLGLLVASPYVVLDFPAVLRDLHAEARPVHPGGSGSGFAGNLAWYVRNSFAGSFGVLGLGFAALGFASALRDRRPLVAATVPGAVLLLIALSAQSLRWERWMVPVFPFVALYAAIGIDALASSFSSRFRPLAVALLVAATALPMLVPTFTALRMRANDTRQIASAWVRAHVPAGASILIEDAAFDLLDRRGKLLFPLGNAGCVDVRDMLRARPAYRRIGAMRQGRAIVDIGHVEPARLPGCRADIAIITHRSRYLAQASQFPGELDAYRRLLRDGRVLATIRPVRGSRGGPVVEIVALSPAVTPP